MDGINRTHEVKHQGPSVMVRCAVTEREIMGSYFFENRIENQDIYKNILRYFAFPELPNYPENTIFQQDGASPHYLLTVRSHFYRKFQNR